MKEVIIALIGGGFFVFLEFLIRRWDEKHNKFKALHNDLSELRTILLKMSEDNEKQNTLIDLQAAEILGLGHDRLIYLTDKIAKRGYITLKEKANLRALYIPYKKLGGNGDSEAGYEHCMNLDVISDEKADKLDRDEKRELYGIKGDSK